MEKLRDEKLICLVEKKKKIEDRKYNLYKFTIMSLLDKTKSNTLYFY